MASTKQRPLHVAKDLETLNKMVDVEVKRCTAKLSAGVLRRALNPMFQEGHKHFANGDEESAYLIYMRYVELAMKEKEKDMEKLQTVMNRLETLKVSLKKRYSQRDVENSLQTLPSPPSVCAPSSNLANGLIHSPIPPKSTPITGPPVSKPAAPAAADSVTPSSPSPSGSARTSANGLLSGGRTSDVASSGPSGAGTAPCTDYDSVVDNSLLEPIANWSHPDQKGAHFVTCADLHSLLVQGKVLVLDCRKVEAFNDSHIKLSPNVINIPKTYMGMTSFQIPTQLSNEHRLLFESRKRFEKVVVVDWDGRGYLSPQAPAACIVEALRKWVMPADGVTVHHLKDGYRFWVAAYPHDTTNSKPNEQFNTETNVPITGRLPTDGGLSSESGGFRGNEPVSAEQLRDLTWLPKSFEQRVQVVNTPTVAPTVTPAGQSPAGSIAQSSSASSHHAISPGGVGSRPVPSAPPVGEAGSGGGDFHHDGPGASELSRVDRSSQDTVKQFTQSVNEKISAVGVPKPRTRSEAGGDPPTPPQPPSSYPKPTIMRSRSLDKIYEENLRDEGFNRPLAFPGKGEADQAGDGEQLRHLADKRPSIDRSLKPSNSLDAATVHRSKDSNQQPLEPASGGGIRGTGVAGYYDGNNNNNNNISSGSSNNRSITAGGGGGVNLNNNNNNAIYNLNNNEANQRNAILSASHTARPTAAVPMNARPNVPPKPRRSQSPVQVYRYGTIDRTTGLRNLGNSCYMNSVLQALAHSTEFARFFVSKEHENHLNVNNPRGSGGKLPGLFSNLLSALWSQNDTRDALGEFRRLMGSLYPMYSTYDQQDSHEFLVNLLDRLHEDLNSAKQRNRPNSSNNSDSVVTFAMLAQELNKFFTAHNDMQLSCVTQNYEGILVSGLQCHTCSKDSYTFQVFNVLSVPIPSVSGVDIFHCFDEFFREEKVEDWLCPHCKAKRTARKHMRIARLPKQLIIHLVRFKNESWTAFSFSSYKKITNVVNFTVELDTRELAQYVYSKEVKLKSYTLYAIVNHYGTISSGHYYSDCRFLPKPEWYRYSDHQVTTLHSKSPDVGSAYMLFYSCVD